VKAGWGDGGSSSLDTRGPGVSLSSSTEAREELDDVFMCVDGFAFILR